MLTGSARGTGAVTGDLEVWMNVSSRRSAMTEVVAGRFALVDRIGTGGTGEVWRAFDLRTGAYCAAKRIREPEAAMLVRAVYEQRVRLQHPHVTTPYAWVADDEQVLLAMPLVRGGSLHTLIRDYGVLPPRYAAELLRQLLSALAHVHAAGLVHRDVKPANVLLEPTGTAAPHLRLADFGLVLAPDRPRVTGTFTIVGTPGYLAPETLVSGEQGTAQDLYAVGRISTEMLGTRSERSGPRAAALWELVAALAAADPTARPRSATEAEATLAELLDGWELEIPARVAGGDETIEVFDQVGPLPSGWGPEGPEEQERPERPASKVEAAEPGDKAGSAEARSAERTEPPAPRRQPVPGGVDPGVSDTGESIPEEPLPAPAPGPRRRNGWTMTALAAAIVSAASAIAALVLFLGIGGGSAAPDHVPNQTPSHASTQGSTSSPGPATQAADPGVTEGGACSWSQAGSVETAAGGRRVRCTQGASGYTWSPVG